MNLTEQPTDYDYPLVTETGVTFVSDADLLRFVAEKCGDEVCRFLEKKLSQAEDTSHVRSRIQRAIEYLWDVDFDEIETAIQSAVGLLEKEAGIKRKEG